MALHFDAATSDAVLAQAVRNCGSEAAFALLYDRHTPRLLQTAWRLLGGSEHDAEDAVQETWMRALRTLASWSGKSPLAAWLRGIVVHVAIDSLRRSRSFPLEREPEYTESDLPLRVDLESAIAMLPPGYRAVLVLHDIEGFTHEEIGPKLGITAGTSKGQLFKARRAVRARLARELEETV